MACLKCVLPCGVGTVLAALLLASACSRHHPVTSRALAGPTGRIALRVTNHNFLAVTVSVLHDGQRTRVGTVTGSSSQVFLLPEHLLGQGRQIQLLGNPIGNTDFALTETLVIQPGQWLRRTARSCGDAAPITGTHEG